MVKNRAQTELLPGQMDLEERLRPYTVEPVPGSDSLYLHEHSVASLYLDMHGREIPNPTPMAPPIGYQKPISIADQIRQAIKQASYEAAMAGAETEEEANDFDVEEDMEPGSQWEHPFDPDPELEAMLALQSRAPAPSSAAVPNPLPAEPNSGPAKAGPDSQPPAASHAAQRT